MKIDIRNIFGSGSSGASVDVKQVMESGAEQPEADASSEAAQMTTEGGSSTSEPTPASNERVESGQADAAGRSSSGQQLELEAPPELEQDAGTSTDEDSEAGLAWDEQAESGQPENAQAAHEGSSSQSAQENIETAETIETIDKAEMPGEIVDAADTGPALESASASDERGELEQAAVVDGSFEPEDQLDSHAESKGDSVSQSGSGDQPDSIARQAGDEGHEVADETPEPVGEAAATPKQPLQIKEKLLAICRRYGWCTGIAAAFAILLAVTLIYTTLTPREVYATINGKEFNFTTKEYTVEEFLQDEKIAFCEEDYISMPLTTYIYDGLKLEINHATDFEVTADGKTKKYKTLDNTVQEALDDAGIKLRDRDIVTPSLDAFMTQDIHIVVQRVEVQQEVVEEAIPFQTVTRNDSSLKEGTTKVATQGQEGKDQVTYEVTYIDGVEASRTEIARQSVTAAVDEVIAKGTRIDYNGKTYSRKLVVKAYAYTGGGRTAMGTRARVGEIAVDRSVIPLGTNVYIEGVGARRAEDTGGNIKGNTIDIYMDSEAECRRWGVRYVTIYIQ